jgi:hypothetical protein
MLCRPVHLLCFAIALGAASAQQPKGLLPPEELSESEAQLILKEQKPKGHVEAAFRVSDARLSSALQHARASRYPEASQDLDFYTGLVTYADRYTRGLPGERRKERGQCLKHIEQRLFKQSATLNAVARELPYDYRGAGERAVETAKQVRLRALDDLLGDGSMFKETDGAQGGH